MTTIEQEGDAFNVTWRVPDTTVSPGILAISDVHFDSRKCNRALLKRNMDEAVQRGAGIMIFGDWLDVMGAKFDPRSGKSDIRSEYQTSNYFQDVVDDSVEFLKPYAGHLLFICQGNHELAVRKRHEIDLLQIMAYKLRQEAGWKGLIGEYEGWIRFIARVGPKGRQVQLKAFYSHGTGGSSPVTMGVIGTNRRQVNIEADLYITAHIHTQWAVPKTRRELSNRGIERLKEVLHVQLGTYKESHKERNGWEAMRGFSPPSIGGYWLRFYFRNDANNTQELAVVEERTRN